MLTFSEEFSLLLVLIGIFATIIVILVITLGLLVCKNKLSQMCGTGSKEEDKPYKPNNINRYYNLGKYLLSSILQQEWDIIPLLQTILSHFSK